jgi:threonine/homoserine/homoserine lactone efflux protein
LNSGPVKSIREASLTNAVLELVWAENFVFGLILGFTLTVPPGPMNAFIASQTMSKGRAAGVLTGLGAMTADLVLGTFVYSARSVVDIHHYIRILYAAGAAVLIFLAYSSLRGMNDGGSTAQGRRTYYRALILGITNPFQILWWVTAGLAFAYIGGIILLIGLFAAIAVWIVSFPVLLHTGTRKYPGLRKIISTLSSLVMIAFAAYFVYLAV